MRLEDLQRHVQEFEQGAGFDKTAFHKLIEMIEEEVAILKAHPHDKAIVDHELTDLLILLMQLANRYGTDFDRELTDWFEKSRKYLKHPSRTTA